MRATFPVIAVITALIVGCSDDPTTPGDSAIDISGTWLYAETTVMVAQPEQEIVRLECVSPEGVLTIEQDGSTFTGTLTHPAGTCQTSDGSPFPPPWTLPYHATLSGSISGELFHFDQFDDPPDPPVHCPKHGSITTANGVAVELRTTGLCDLSVLPFPALATNAGVASSR